jgi:phosphotransferase system enzyme I (PtsI)
MFPFASGPADLDLALELAETAAAELRREGVSFGEDLPLGLTLEVPSAALTADLLASRVEFFSVGTNDLIQYLLAVDRADPRVTPLYQPLHPAVLRTIAHIVKAAAAYSLPVGVCGEMAATPALAVLLVGLGVRELSMAPAAIPKVRAALRAVEAARAQRIGEACLDLRSDVEIEKLLKKELHLVEAAVSTA